MVNKFGVGIGGDATKQRRNNFAIRSIRRVFVNSYTEREARGFTFLELLVSIGIFTIITMIVVAGFQSGAQADTLRLAADDAAGQLRALSGMAQTGRRIGICTGSRSGVVCEDSSLSVCPDSCLEQVPQGGYGVHIDRNTEPAQLIFFADSMPGEPAHGYTEGEMLPGEGIHLPRFVVIDDISVVGSPTRSETQQGIRTMDIVFEPPEPVIWFNGLQQGIETRIRLRHEKTEKTRTIVVRRLSGLIEVE